MYFKEVLLPLINCKVRLKSVSISDLHFSLIACKLLFFKSTEIYKISGNPGKKDTVRKSICCKLIDGSEIGQLLS